MSASVLVSYSSIRIRTPGCALGRLVHGSAGRAQHLYRKPNLEQRVFTCIPDHHNEYKTVRAPPGPVIEE